MTNMITKLDLMLYLYFMTVTMQFPLVYTNAVASPHKEKVIQRRQDYSVGGYDYMYNEPHNTRQYGYYDHGYGSGYGPEYTTGRRNNLPVAESIGHSVYGYGGYHSRLPKLPSNTASNHYDSKGTVPVSVSSTNTMEVNPGYEHSGTIHTSKRTIEVTPHEFPVKIIFNTRSVPVNVHQSHTPGGHREIKATHSEDEPHKVFHEVRRPVIQEIREIISPYRKVIQEILPVEENVQTIVTKSDKYNNGQAKNQLASYQDHKTQTNEEETKSYVPTTRKDNKYDNNGHNSRNNAPVYHHDYKTHDEDKKSVVSATREDNNHKNYDEQLDSYIGSLVPSFNKGMSNTISGSGRRFKLKLLENDEKTSPSE